MLYGFAKFLMVTARVVNAQIKNCKRVKAGKISFCSERPEYPCKHVIRLDKRYKSSSGISVIENLNEIRAHGLITFDAGQKRKWACPNCGELLCMHKSICINCGQTW